MKICLVMQTRFQTAFGAFEKNNSKVVLHAVKIEVVGNSSFGEAQHYTLLVVHWLRFSLWLNPLKKI